MQRSFGTVISANRPRGNELTTIQRSLIIEKKEAGISIVDIATQIGCHPRTVHKTLTRWKTLHIVKSSPRSGRPPVLSDRAVRLILRVCRKERKITWQQLYTSHTPIASPATYKRRFSELGYTHTRCARKPRLNKDARTKRLNFALKYKDWDHLSWRKVIFSDECSVERGTGRPRDWCWRRDDEKYHQDCITATSKGKDMCIMIWAAIYGEGDCRSNVTFMERDDDAPRQGYTANSYLLFVLDELETIFEPGMTFMQDNAPIHKSRKVLQAFEDAGIPLLDWPPHSPDLNPIEHLWWVLKKEIYEANPHLLYEGRSENDYISFQTAIEQAWAAIPSDKIRGLIDSMPRRIQAVLDAKGGHTKY